MAEESRPEQVEGQTQASEVNDAASAEASTGEASERSSRPVYEVGFHLVPQVGDEGLAAVVDNIRAALGGAEILKEQFPAKMRLAYVLERARGGRREKFAESYFGWIKFAAEREAMPALGEKLRGMEEILRFLIIGTVREDIARPPRRAVFVSDRLEGETIAGPKREAEKGGEISEEELDKSIEALVQ